MKNKKTKKKLSQSAIVLIISAVIIAIPIVVFLTIIISARLNTGTPQTGDRYKYDLSTEITSPSIDYIEASIKAIDDVEDCEITLITSQLRINVDANDSISKEGTLDLVNQIYEIVIKQLPIDTYFTISSNGEKMYDLAINVYNYADNSNGTMIYYCLTKNSKMDDYEIQLLSEPKDPELAEELRNPEQSSDTQEEQQTSE